MAAPCYPLLFALLLLARAADPDCVQDDGESRCSLSSAPQRLLLLDDRLIVGAIDSVYSFSPTLTLLDSADISPSAARSERCEGAQQPALCRNFVRVVQQVNESSLLVCGTNAFFPKCRFHQLNNLSDWDFMTAETQKDLGFSPHSNNANVAVLADNGAFFTATTFNFRQIQQTIGMSPLLLNGDGTFTVQTPPSRPQWIGNDLVFVSAYDIGEHVYFFARERAFEVVGAEVVYSRIIRVCKNDSGIGLFPGDSTLTFRTFQKARLRCRSAGRDDSIPYDYDRLQATFLHRPSDGGEPTLYGTFSSPTNGPEGAALCKFSLSNLNSVFDAGEYWVLDSSGISLSINIDVFNCPGEDRTLEQARNHQLVSNIAIASEPQPVATLSGEELTHVAVDEVEYDGSQLEVVVFGHSSGHITQLVQFRGAFYKNTIRQVSSDITDMLLHKDPESEERCIIIATDSSVQSFTLGKCSLHSTCFKCFDSHDPYCVWDQNKSKCVNKLADSTLTPTPDSLTSSEDTVVGICGSRMAPPPHPPSVNPSSCPHTPTDRPPSSTDPTTTTGEPSVNTPVHLDQETDEKGENPGLLAGATVGGFLFGVPVGLVVCYMFFSVFLKKNTNSQDHVTSQNTTTTLQINQLTLEKQPLSSRFLEQTQVVHRNSTTSGKNVNRDDIVKTEEDDILTDLPCHNNGIPRSKLCLQQPMPPAVPGYRIPCGRSDSTQWLGASDGPCSPV